MEEEEEEEEVEEEEEECFHQQIALKFKEDLMKCFFTSLDLCGNVNWTLVDQNYLALGKDGEDQLGRSCEERNVT